MTFEWAYALGKAANRSFHLLAGMHATPGSNPFSIWTSHGGHLPWEAAGRADQGDRNGNPLTRTPRSNRRGWRQLQARPQTLKPTRTSMRCWPTLEQRGFRMASFPKAVSECSRQAPGRCRVRENHRTERRPATKRPPQGDKSRPRQDDILSLLPWPDDTCPRSVSLVPVAAPHPPRRAAAPRELSHTGHQRGGSCSRMVADLVLRHFEHQFVVHPHGSGGLCAR